MQKLTVWREGRNSPVNVLEPRSTKDSRGIVVRNIFHPVPPTDYLGTHRAIGFLYPVFNDDASVFKSHDILGNLSVICPRDGLDGHQFKGELLKNDGSCFTAGRFAEYKSHKSKSRARTSHLKQDGRSPIALVRDDERVEEDLPC